MDLMQATPVVGVLEYSGPDVSRRYCCLSPPLPLDLAIFLLPLPQWSLSLGRKDVI